MKIAVLTLQGLGRPNPKYSAKLESNLRKKLNDSVLSRIKFFPIDYHSTFQDNQDELWAVMLKHYKRKLRQRHIRQFMLDYFSDAVTYESDKIDKDSVYMRVHAKIHATISEAYDYAGDHGLLVIIAQSLGGQIISNYIWDIQKSDSGELKGLWLHNPLPGNDFQKLKTLRIIFTSGCNIPLFVSGYERIEAISMPNALFEWYNYFDKNDILGWPLKTLSKTGENDVLSGYNEIITADVQINTGIWLLSHIRYWKRRTFYKRVVRKINAL